MRVISGISKGHKLKAPKGKDTRPTEDKVKESLFNILGDISNESIILDLFAGTGSIGIEFLSRGAKKAYFVDISGHNISIIHDNLNHTKLMEKSVVFKRNGIRTIKYFEKENIAFDYIYLDPPFDKHDLLLNTIDEINKNLILKEKGILIVEHEKQLKLNVDYSKLKKIDDRKYGNKILTFYKRIL